MSNLTELKRDFQTSDEEESGQAPTVGDPLIRSRLARDEGWKRHVERPSTSHWLVDPTPIAPVAERHDSDDHSDESLGKPEATERGQKYGQSPRGKSTDEKIEAARKRGEKALQKLLESSKPHLTLAEVQEKLGWSPRRMQNAIDENRIHYVESGEDQPLIPGWQISDGEPLDGLEAVMANLPGHGWKAALIFFHSPHFLLNGRTPAEMLVDGRDLEAVKLAASKYGRHGAA